MIGHWYYPSGTKPKEGSRLDQIAERCRASAEAGIIQMLREAKGEDLGDDLEHWISSFGGESPNEWATRFIKPPIVARHSPASVEASDGRCLATGQYRVK